MKKKQIIRITTQTLLVMSTTFVILKFYQYDTVPYTVKWIATIALIAVNCVYHHWCGLRNGIEMNEKYESRIRELEEENFNIIADMFVEEKTNDRAVE